MVDEPRKVWQAAVDLVKRTLPAVNAYVANIVEDEPPVAGGGEAGGGGAPGEGGTAAEGEAETADAGGEPGAAAAEMLAALTLAAPAGGGGEGPSGGDAGEDGGEAGAVEEGDDVEHGAKPALPPDYSNCLLSYVAASTGQEFMTRLELRRRPVALGSGSHEAAEGAAGAQAVTPETFRLLDEHLPLLEVRVGASVCRQSQPWCVPSVQLCVMIGGCLPA
jgi:hypothetical protein